MVESTELGQLKTGIRLKTPKSVKTETVRTGGGKPGEKWEGEQYAAWGGNI